MNWMRDAMFARIGWWLGEVLVVALVLILIVGLGCLMLTIENRNARKRRDAYEKADSADLPLPKD